MSKTGWQDIHVNQCDFKNSTFWKLKFPQGSREISFQLANKTQKVASL